MEAIKKNPYRIIGILVGTSSREQERQVRRLKQLIDAEQVPINDYSFPILGNLIRTEESVNNATSKLNLNRDKMNAALFWFYNYNNITDEPSFESLIEGNQEITKEIWKKQVTSGEVTKRNCSAFQNLSTLLLCNAFNDSVIDPDLLELGIMLKLKFLESDFIKDYKALATDETFKVTKSELEVYFLNQVQSEINTNGGITTYKYLELIKKQDFLAKDDFFKGFVQKLIEQIEKSIQSSKGKRNENESKAGIIGIELFNTTKKDLAVLRSILGPSDLKFNSISDKLATELLQCGIILFNHFYDTETEVGEISLDLNKKAESIALGSVAKEKINESIPIIIKYINDKPKREKKNIVSEDYKFLISKIEKFQTTSDSISHATEFATTCKPHLEKIKMKLGVTDDLYLAISTDITGNIQGMIVSAVNNSMNKGNKYGNDKIDSAERLENIIDPAWKAIVNLGSFDMSNKQRENYNKNKISLKNIYKQINTNILFFNDTPINKWLLWLGGILVFLLLIFAIWGGEGIQTVFSIVAFIGILWLIGWLRGTIR